LPDKLGCPLACELAGGPTGKIMLNLPNYARALRCIGQALQNLEIEVFELKTYPDDYRLTAGDPRPPYTGLIELSFSPQRIEVLDREGQARRGRSNVEMRFDTVPEMLRALGEYLDNKRVQLRRIDNSAAPDAADLPALTLEYQTRAGEVETEDLPMSFIHDTSVRMYKRRSRITNPVEMLTRKR
jgi:hypothetical protein